MNRNVRRRFASTASLAVIYALTVLALVPLGLVLWYTLVRGLPAVSHVCLLYTSPSPRDS